MVPRAGPLALLRPVTMVPRAGPLALLCLVLSVSRGRPSSLHRPGCFKVHSCKCIMKDGSGVIGLRAMGDAEGFLGHLLPLAVQWGPAREEGEEKLLSFSPCQPFSQPLSLPELTGTSQCSSVAACVYVRSSDGGSFLNYGRHEGNEFRYNASLRELSVSYFRESTAAAEQEQPLTIVHYHCSPNQTSSSIRGTQLSPGGPLHIWVDSPCACPNACAFEDLGLGTIYLIMLSVSAVAYFVLGSCALRPFRSSSGVNISPEPSVWCMICYHCSENRPRDRHHGDQGPSSRHPSTCPRDRHGSD